MFKQAWLCGVVGLALACAELAVLSYADDKRPDNRAAPPRAQTAAPRNDPAAVNDNNRRNTGANKQNSSACRVREIDGMVVRDPSGEELGKIEDLVINLHDGQVAYAALSFGGVLGIGNKLFAIPWDALELKTETNGKKESRHFVLAVEKERLKNAPGFDKEHWPNLADPTWSREVDDFYSKDTKSARRVNRNPNEPRKQ